MPTHHSNNTQIELQKAEKTKKNSINDLFTKVRNSSLTEEDVTQYVTDYGSIADLKDEHGQCLLQVAIFNGEEPEVVKLLIKHGVDKNILPGTTKTPLELAIHFKKFAIAIGLVEEDAIITDVVKNQLNLNIAAYDEINTKFKRQRSAEEQALIDKVKAKILSTSPNQTQFNATSDMYAPNKKKVAIPALLFGLLFLGGVALVVIGALNLVGIVSSMSLIGAIAGVAVGSCLILCPFILTILQIKREKAKPTQELDNADYLNLSNITTININETSSAKHWHDGIISFSLAASAAIGVGMITASAISLLGANLMLPALAIGIGASGIGLFVLAAIGCGYLFWSDRKAPISISSDMLPHQQREKEFVEPISLTEDRPEIQPEITPQLPQPEQQVELTHPTNSNK